MCNAHLHIDHPASVWKQQSLKVETSRYLKFVQEKSKNVTMQTIARPQITVRVSSDVL